MLMILMKKKKNPIFSVRDQSPLSRNSELFINFLNIRKQIIEIKKKSFFIKIIFIYSK